MNFFMRTKVVQLLHRQQNGFYSIHYNHRNSFNATNLMVYIHLIIANWCLQIFKWNNNESEFRLFALFRLM